MRYITLLFHWLHGVQSLVGRLWAPIAVRLGFYPESSPSGASEGVAPRTAPGRESPPSGARDGAAPHAAPGIPDGTPPVCSPPEPESPTPVPEEVYTATYARSLPKSKYKDLRDKMRLDFLAGVPLWTPAPTNRKLNPILRARFEGYYEDGEWGVPRGILFPTTAQREAAEAWLKQMETWHQQLPLPHVPAVPTRGEVLQPVDCPADPQAVAEFLAKGARDPESAGGVLARILKKQSVSLEVR